MSILINFKICDNAEECSGLTACKMGAIYWDKKNETLSIDNSKCTSCGACVKRCELGAIKVAKTAEDYQKLEKEINDDPRKITDLFVDRYGAQPVLATFLTTEHKFNPNKLRKLNAVEFFNDNSIECLLKSIPISELLNGLDINYTRVKLEGNKLKDKYKVKELPSLLFFSGPELIGKVEGYFELKEKEEFRSKINQLIKDDFKWANS